MSSRSLIEPSANPLLAQALALRLERLGGGFGELEPLGLRLGLMQNTLRPRLQAPRLVVFAADHGHVVEGTVPDGARSTADEVVDLLAGRTPLAALARAHGVDVSVVDCGVASDLAPHERLLRRKIAHGTRNARIGAAMTVEQAHAAMRAGMEIGEALRGDALLCAGMGVGADPSAALVLATLGGLPLARLALPGPALSAARSQRLMKLLRSIRARHRSAADPVEVLAAFGGFEVAVMAGVMLMAASRRRLLVVDGLAACAALKVASRIADAVTDYCVFSRSHAHVGLGGALAMFRAAPLLELGLESQDGTGAVLGWPLLRSAAALLAEAEPGAPPPALPVGVEAPEVTPTD